MRAALFALGLACAAGCTSTRKCAPNTVFVDINYEGAALQATDIIFSTMLSGVSTPAPTPTPFTHVAGVAKGSVLVEFPHHYPKGSTLTITVTAFASAPPAPSGFVASTSLPILLTDSCERVSLTLGVTPDLGSDDLAGADLSGVIHNSMPDLSGADLLPNPLLCPGTVGFPDPPLVSVQLPIGADSAALGDADGDGKLDVFTSSETGFHQPGTISIYRNLGGASFAAPANYSHVGDYLPSVIAVGDLNGDGKADVANVSEGPNLLVFINKGDGTLGMSVQDYSAQDEAYALALGDFDGINGVDIAVLNNNQTPQAVQVFLNQGGGTFPTAAPTYSTGNDSDSQDRSFNAVAVGDFNKDSKLDLVVTEKSTNQILLFANAGDGTFPSVSPFPVGMAPNALGVGDLDGDGYPDLVVGNSGDSDLSVLINNKSGGFLPQVIASASGTSVVVQDLDGDNRAEVLVSSTAGIVQVLHNNGDGTLAKAVVYSAGGNNTSNIMLGDMDGDGKLDVVTNNHPTPPGTTPPPTGNFAVLHNYGAGKFNSTATAVSSQTAYPTGGMGPYSLAIADVTGDGKLDVVVAHELSNNVTVLPGNGDGSFAAVGTPISVGMQPRSLALGDLDGNGFTDIAVANYGDGTVSILTNDAAGHGQFAVKTPLNVGLNPDAVVIGELDGKSGLDLAVANSADKNVGILLSRGGGSFAPQVTYTTQNDPRGIAIANLYGDSLPALVDANGGALRNNGDGTFAPLATWPTFLFGADAIVVGKFLPQTSTLDQVVYAATAANRIAFNNVEVTTAGNGPVAIAMGDFNLDGLPDFVVANSQDNTVSMYLQKDTSTPLGAQFTFGPGVSWGVGQVPRSVAVADLDGDGRPDLVVANHDSNTISVMLNHCLP